MGRQWEDKISMISGVLSFERDYIILTGREYIIYVYCEDKAKDKDKDKDKVKYNDGKGQDWLQILLPCLGHQSCGALSKPEDWCHEEVTWWRPPYFKKIDQMASLDRKTLPFSYLVLAKSRRSREEILPELMKNPLSTRHRLVSPTHHEGRQLEFYVCGQDGKRKARYLPPKKLDKDSDEQLQRGDIINLDPVPNQPSQIDDTDT